MNFDAHLTLWILSLEMQDAEDRPIYDLFFPQYALMIRN